MPVELIPHRSMAAQQRCIIRGTSTLSRIICSARSTPNVGLIPPPLPLWLCCDSAGELSCWCSVVLDADVDGTGPIRS